MDYPKDVELMARAIVRESQWDPDLLVQPGSPEVYGTASGHAFVVTPGSEVPLWTMYVASAQKMLAIARTIEPVKGLSTPEIKPLGLVG